MTTRQIRDHANGWCCVDCLVYLANAETPPELDEEATEAYVARVWGAGAVSLGRMFGEDGCEHTAEAWHAGEGQEEHAETCERDEFSMGGCDVCGSTFGGAREAVTFWLS